MKILNQVPTYISQTKCHLEFHLNKSLNRDDFYLNKMETMYQSQFSSMCLLIYKNTRYSHPKLGKRQAKSAQKSGGTGEDIFLKEAALDPALKGWIGGTGSVSHSLLE